MTDEDRKETSPRPVPLSHAAANGGKDDATDSPRERRGEFGCLLPGLIVAGLAAGTAVVTGEGTSAGWSLPCLFWLGALLAVAGGAFRWMNRNSE